MISTLVYRAWPSSVRGVTDRTVTQKLHMGLIRLVVPIGDRADL